MQIAQPMVDDAILNTVQQVLHSGQLAQGTYVQDFEHAFAKYLGVNHAVATNSGTSALHTALAALDVTKGDEMITSDFSFIASASSVMMQQATPVFCDIDPVTYTISPDDIRDKITDRTRAIIPVHLYGHPCDMDPIQEIAHDHDLLVIEDACQAHGALYNEQMIGSLGDVGVFSFYPTKNITTGEGGMLTTNDAEIAETARMIRNHGQSQRYYHDRLGYNYRMTNLAAVIGLEQLKRLDEFNDTRIHNAEYLSRNIDHPSIVLPQTRGNVKHVFHQYTIQVTDTCSVSRDDLAQYLKDHDIGYGIYYPVPLHRQPVFNQFKFTDKQVMCPVACRMAETVLSLPVHPGLNKEDLDAIVAAMYVVGES